MSWLIFSILQEQANEREQEHEDYQKELEKWKKIVQDIEKQNGSDKRLQTEVCAGAWHTNAFIQTYLQIIMWYL